MIEFKKSISYPENLEISKCGLVRGVKTKKKLKLIRKSEKGVITVQFGYKGKTLNKRLHDLVAEIYCDKPDGPCFVKHIDGDKGNNFYKNLIWVNEVSFKKSISYPELFEVSKCGKVKSVRTGIIYKLNKNKYGYETISTRINGRGGKILTVKVHRLVAEVYCENPNNYPIVNHIDGIKDNNRCENLEWCTAKQNTNHGFEIGLIVRPKGEECYQSKLTNQDVKYIRENYKYHDREFGAVAFSKKFNTSPQTILKVINRQTYKNID